ncbi:MAG: hypothetical protein R2705_03160 [Ilumatobacteraceae bacterium]
MGRGRTDTLLISTLGAPGPEGMPTRRRRPDELVVEEPMEIDLDGVVVATTMRTLATTTSSPWGSATATGCSAGRRSSASGTALRAAR